MDRSTKYTKVVDELIDADDNDEDSNSLTMYKRHLELLKISTKHFEQRINELECKIQAKLAKEYINL